MGTKRNAFIHKIAAYVLQQIDCSHKFINSVYDEETRAYHRHDLNAPEFPRIFWDEYGPKVIAVVGKIDTSSRGRLLACGVQYSGNGRLAYHEVNGGLCDTKVSGSELLTLLASHVITAAIIDILRQKNQLMQEFEARQAAFTPPAPPISA